MIYVSQCGSLVASSSFLGKFCCIALPKFFAHLATQVSCGSSGFEFKCALRDVLTNFSKTFSNASTIMNNVARLNCVRLNGYGTEAAGGMSLDTLDNDMVLSNPKKTRKQEHAASIHKPQHRNELCLLGCV